MGSSYRVVRANAVRLPPMVPGPYVYAGCWLNGTMAGTNSAAYGYALATINTATGQGVIDLTFVGLSSGVAISSNTNLAAHIHDQSGTPIVTFAYPWFGFPLSNTATVDAIDTTFFTLTSLQVFLSILYLCISAHC
jgi:hypothetical protein